MNLPDKPPSCKYMQIVPDEFAPYVYAIDAHYVEDTVSLTYLMGVKGKSAGRIHLASGKWTYSINVDSQIGIYVSAKTLLSFLEEKK